MNGEFRPCAVIPCYNHPDKIEDIVKGLRQRDLPVVVVDDGSAASCARVLDGMACDDRTVTVITHPRNLGKGAAVTTGLRSALASGYTHALQIDADGQHCLDDAGGMLERAAASPEAVVCAQPVFDSTLPMVRRWARKITHFWVGVETLTNDPVDTMCGFRVYPLDKVCGLLDANALGMRMDFDIEVMVRLIWEGVDIIRVDSAVRYDVPGASHFRGLQDNLLISWLHTRLVVGMLARLVKGPRPAGGSGEAHWSRIQERGSLLGIHFLLWCYRLLGRQVVKYLTVPIVLYFYLTSGTRRTASLDFLGRVYDYAGPSPGISGQPGFGTGFRHFRQFAYAAVDKVAAWTGEIMLEDIRFDDAQKLIDVAESGKGAVIIVSHLGNIEVSRAFVDRFETVKLNSLFFTEHARNYNAMLSSIDPRVQHQIIEVSEIGPETAMMLQEKTDQGELIVIVGDRTPTGSASRVTMVDFLGKSAAFAQGPFIIASLFDCPVYLMFCLQEGDGYRAYFEHFADGVDLPRKDRNAALQTITARYASRLEHYCLHAPLQWYNFYDFWHYDEDVP